MTKVKAAVIATTRKDTDNNNGQDESKNKHEINNNQSHQTAVLIAMLCQVPFPSFSIHSPFFPTGDRITELRYVTTLILLVAFVDARYRLHFRRTCLHLSHKGLFSNSSGHMGVGTLHRTPQAISVFLSKPLDKDLEELVSDVLLGLVCNVVGGHYFAAPV